MYKIIIKPIIGFLLFVLTVNSYAQQEAMFSHYMYNNLAVNPAYAGSRDALTITALHRSQWVGLNGAPTTQTLTMHTPFNTENLGLGLSLINDNIGPLRTTSFYGDFAYMLKTTERSKLVFGLKGGGRIFQANLNQLELDTEGDQTFAEDTFSEFLPNFGFGLYLNHERYYAGFSIPKLFENKVKIDESDVVMHPDVRHYFLIAGAVFKASPNVDIKPTTYIKITSGAPIEADLNITAIYKLKFNLGIAYRTGDAITAMTGYQIDNQFMIGYAYDWSFGIQSSTENAGSHEIMLRYDFIYKEKEKIRSPRYF